MDWENDGAFVSAAVARAHKERRHLHRRMLPLFVLSEALNPVDERIVVYIVGDIPAHLVGDGTVFLHDGKDCFL